MWRLSQCLRTVHPPTALPSTKRVRSGLGAGTKLVSWGLETQKTGFYPFLSLSSIFAQKSRSMWASYTNVINIGLFPPLWTPSLATMLSKLLLAKLMLSSSQHVERYQNALDVESRLSLMFCRSLPPAVMTTASADRDGRLATLMNQKWSVYYALIFNHATTLGAVTISYLTGATWDWGKDCKHCHWCGVFCPARQKGQGARKIKPAGLDTNCFYQVWTFGHPENGTLGHNDDGKFMAKANKVHSISFLCFFFLHWGEPDF